MSPSIGAHSVILLLYQKKKKTRQNKQTNKQQQQKKNEFSKKYSIWYMPEISFWFQGNPVVVTA